jgi:flagellar hook-basal body protein
VSLQGVSSNASGNGVRVAAVAQQFAQGNIEFTDSNLDLAVSGQGMFILSDNGALAYTRAGAFQMNRDGYVVNSAQQRLQVYPPLAAAASTPAVSPTCACRPRTRRRGHVERGIRAEPAGQCRPPPSPCSIPTIRTPSTRRRR